MGMMQGNSLSHMHRNVIKHTRSQETSVSVSKLMFLQQLILPWKKSSAASSALVTATASITKRIFVLINTSGHDDAIKWKHFPCYWPFVQGIHQSPVNSPHKGQWRGALMFSLICAWINGWVNNRETGGLRRHHVHYDVTLMNCLRFNKNDGFSNKWSLMSDLQPTLKLQPIFLANTNKLCITFIL